MKAYKTISKVIMHGPGGDKTSRIIRAVDATCYLDAIRKGRAVALSVLDKTQFPGCVLETSATEI